MKEFLDKILGRKNELRSRIFRVILIAAAVLTVGGLIEDTIVTGDRLMLFPMVILAAAVGLSMFFNFRLHKEEISLWILGIVLVTGVLPIVYFTSGGLRGGATNWLVLGLVYVFLMFDGIKLLIMASITLVSIVLTYVVGYCFPDQINALESPFFEVMDSLVSVVAIGLVVGGIVKFQLYVYEQERKINIQQKEQLEEAGKAKNMFFAKISHEIRTPINTIIGLNEMNLREALPMDALENSVNMQKAAVSLLGLVNELLDLSQIETSKMELYEEEYESKRLFYNLVDMVQIRAKAKHLKFQVEVDPNLPKMLKGDEKRISQILVNLLTNAVKYTDQGVVSLEAHLETISDTEIWLIVSVSDTGIGLRKEDIPHLFEYYRRVDQRNTHSIEGSGLGLSITKQLLDLMQGEITVDSIYKKGSTFRVRIRQEVVDPEPIGLIDFGARMRERSKFMQGGPGRPYAAKFEAPEAKILLVDDALMNIEVLKKLLRATKVKVEGVTSGEEALACTSKHYYHLIFLDYMMPGMNGAELLQAIRQQEDGLCRETPVVCLTGTAKTDSGGREMSYGFDGYLQKPVRGELLEGTVLRFLPDDVIEFQRKAENPQEEETLMSQLVVNRITNHRKKRVCITTNGLSDLGRERAEQCGVRIIYSYIETEKGRFLDTLEIDGKNVKNYLTQYDTAAKAVSPSVEDYESFFADTLEEAEEVIHISVADHVGESYKNALIAAGSFDHVQVVNSGLLSGGLALLVISAAGMTKRGMNVSEIMEAIKNTRGRIASSFVFPTVNLLVRNHYAGPVIHFMGKALRVHPVFWIKKSGLHFHAFKTGSYDVARRRYIRSLFRFRHKIDTEILYVTHAGGTIREMDALVREIRKYVNFEKVIIEQSCVACAVNSGLGTISVAYLRK